MSTKSGFLNGWEDVKESVCETDVLGIDQAETARKLAKEMVKERKESVRHGGEGESQRVRLDGTYYVLIKSAGSGFTGETIGSLPHSLDTLRTFASTVELARSRMHKAYADALTAAYVCKRMDALHWAGRAEFVIADVQLSQDISFTAFK